MGQRLNISVRNENKILASGYWHWGGYTNQIFQFIEDIIPILKDYHNDYDSYNLYSELEIAILLLEQLDCKISNDRNEGRLKVYRDQDTSEANVIIYLDKDYITFINCFYSTYNQDIIVNIPIKELSESYFDNIYKNEDELVIANKTYYKLN